MSSSLTQSLSWSWTCVVKKKEGGRFDRYESHWLFDLSLSLETLTGPCSWCGCLPVTAAWLPTVRGFESRTTMDEDFPTLKPRRIQNQNVVHRLERRRICSGRPGAHWYRVRCFHQNLFPNFTVVNVEKPPCFLRKFSPDGRCFIAFSSDQTSLEVRRGKLTLNLNRISSVILNVHLAQSETHSLVTRKYRWCSSYRYMNTKAARQLRTCWGAKKERLCSPTMTSAPWTSEDACLSASSLCSMSQTWPRTESTWTGSAASSQMTAVTSLSDRLFMYPRSRPLTSLRYQLSTNFKKEIQS